MILSLVPVDDDVVANVEFGEVVEGVEIAKSVGPGEVAPAMSGQNGGELVVFRSTEVGYEPDTLLEKGLVVLALVDFTSDTDRVDDEAVFFGKRRIKIW